MKTNNDPRIHGVPPSVGSEIQRALATNVRLAGELERRHRGIGSRLSRAARAGAGLQRWPAWCRVPLNVAVGELDSDGGLACDGDDRPGVDPGVAAAVSGWAQRPEVVVFSPGADGHAAGLDPDCHLNVEAFDASPVWCRYHVSPPSVRHTLGVLGWWAVLDYDLVTGRSSLVLVVDLGGPGIDDLRSFPVALDCPTLDDALSEACEASFADQLQRLSAVPGSDTELATARGQRDLLYRLVRMTARPLVRLTVYATRALADGGDAAGAGVHRYRG
jgi:hypothetical protein